MSLAGFTSLAARCSRLLYARLRPGFRPVGRADSRTVASSHLMQLALVPALERPVALTRAPLGSLTPLVVPLSFDPRGGTATPLNSPIRPRAKPGHPLAGLPHDRLSRRATLHSPREPATMLTVIGLTQIGAL